MKKNYRKPRIKFIELDMEAALLAASGTMPTGNNGLNKNGASNNSNNSTNSIGWLAPTAHGIVDDDETEN